MNTSEGQREIKILKRNFRSDISDLYIEGKFEAREESARRTMCNSP